MHATLSPSAERDPAVTLRVDDDDGADGLVPGVYEELRALANRRMFGRVGETLQPTALVHEAYLRLAAAKTPLQGREHVLAVAARAMRQILVDHARRAATDKRGGGWERVTMSLVGDDPRRGVDVLDLEDALTRLADDHPRPARVAELRFFAGLEVTEVAAVLEVSASTVKSEWRFARAWLRAKLEGKDG